MSIYHGTIEKEFHLWERRMKTALRRKGLTEALREGPVCKKTLGNVLLIISAALDDNPLRYIQDCDMAKAAWDKVQHRYVDRTTVNMLGVFNSLLKMK